MNASGYKLEYIAKQCDLTYQGLLNKVNNKSEFKASEIQTLKDMLKLTEEESLNIFFYNLGR